MEYLIGIDIGTTNIKGVLFDRGGSVIAKSESTYKTYYQEQGSAEQDANDWWKEVQTVSQKMMSQVEETVKKHIKGISISSQTPTLLPVDYLGIPLRNAIIWMDRRAEQELDEILNSVGCERYTKITGMLPAVSFLPAKLLWMMKNEMDILKKTHYILQANGYVNYKLTGEYSLDLDQASLTQCIDMSTGKWSQEIEKAIGMHFKDYFPEPVVNSKIIGYVTEEASKMTHLPINIPVVAGTSDAIAAMYASGLSKMGEATEVAGTSSLVFAGTHAPPKTYHTVSAQKCNLDTLPFVFNAPITATGASIKWFIDKIGFSEEEILNVPKKNVFELMNRKALQSNPGSNGIIFFPYMMGERAPLWNNHAKGMFIGLSMNSSKEDIIRSIFEGTSYALKSVLEEFERNGTKIESLRVVGGGAKSETWLKIKASILNIPIYVLEEKTGDVPFGDAIIAGLAVGIYKDVTETIRNIIKVKNIIYPNKEWVEIYKARYVFFKKFYEDLDLSLKEYEQICKTTINTK